MLQKVHVGTGCEMHRGGGIFVKAWWRAQDQAWARAVEGESCGDWLWRRSWQLLMHKESGRLGGPRCLGLATREGEAASWGVESGRITVLWGACQPQGEGGRSSWTDTSGLGEGSREEGERPSSGRWVTADLLVAVYAFHWQWGRVPVVSHHQQWDCTCGV